MNWFVSLVLGCAVAYFALVAAMYFAQTWLIFPTRLAEFRRPELPVSAERLRSRHATARALWACAWAPREAGLTVARSFSALPGMLGTPRLWP